jgi:hypothetical protein
MTKELAPPPRPDRLALCTGMPRSGSMWSFNVCRSLLASAHPGACIVGLYSENIAETLAARDDAYRVIKCHAVDERGRDAIRQGNCRCIYTHRDPREAMTSTMKFAAVSFEAALGSLEFLSFQRQFGKLLCLAYAEITGAPRLAVRNIAEHLALDVDETAIAEADRLSGRAEAAAVIERIDSLPTTEVHRDNRYVYDRRSLLHRNHLTGVGAQWRTVLSDDLGQADRRGDAPVGRSAGLARISAGQQLLD